jgi:Fe-S-cluster containining protein
MEEVKQDNLSKNDEAKSNMEKMIKDIEDNNKFLTENNEIEYKCDACGRCCYNQDILLSSLDILRLRRAMQVPTMGLRQYQEIYPGHTSKMPVCLLKFIKISNEGERDISTCPFLKPNFYKELDVILQDKNKTQEQKQKELEEVVNENAKKNNLGSICSINKDKPEICRLYPLGRGFVGKKDDNNADLEVKYFMLEQDRLPCKKECFSSAFKKTVKEFLTENHIGMFTALQEKYYKNMIKLTEVTTKKQISSNDYNMLVNIYYNFDTILLFQKVAEAGVPMPTVEKSESYLKVKEMFKDVPLLDHKILLEAMDSNSSEIEIFDAFEHLIEVQSKIIDNLAKKYAEAKVS